MSHFKLGSGNRIDRLNRWLDHQFKAHLPDWLYREITFQPDRFFKPSNRTLEMRLIYFLIAVSVVMLAVSVWQQW